MSSSNKKKKKKEYFTILDIMYKKPYSTLIAPFHNGGSELTSNI